VAPFDLQWVLAALAGILLLAAYINKHPIQQIRQAIAQYRNGAFKQRSAKNETAIAHDNYIN
jgi:hypothetical protein